MLIEFTPSNVCARKFYIEVEDNLITNFKAEGGCGGNLKGIGKLLQGRKVDEVISLLEGISCMGSRTKNSCPNEIARALQENAV